MIFGGPHKVGSGRCARDKYARKTKKPPQAMLHLTGSKLPMGHEPQPDDIVFTKVDASWVHNLDEDALIITIEIANSLIHRLLVDSGSAVNILYWGAYQKTGLRRADLTMKTSPLDRFIGDSVIPEGTIKLVVTLKELP